MTGKHLYKKTSQLILLFFCITFILFANPVYSSNQIIDRHSLLVEFLRLTDKQPQWLQVERLRGLEAALKELKYDGLNPNHYQLSRIQGLLEEDELVLSELSAAEDALISSAYLEAIADLMLGRTRHSSVEAYLNYQRERPNHFNQVVNHAIRYIDNPEHALALARPQISDYNNLRVAYKRLADKSAYAVNLPVISPDRPSLRVGMTDARVPLLRQHLQQPIPTAHADLYDQALSDLVKEFQSQQGLEADGIAGPQTIARFNRTPEDDLKVVKVNLERWRRLNPSITESRVIANIPSATLEYYQDNQLILSTRTQVGRKDRKTPLMISEISHFTLNPTWTIPPTIYRNDKLPAIQNNPDYLQSNRLTVLDTQGNRLDPELIDWSNPGAIILRQSAGPHNALGQVVIRFPNQQSIYLHDTPNQRLFDRQQRFFSSGCIRVEDATQLVTLLLESTQSAQATQFDSLLSSGVTRNVNIADPVTIILGYWTLRADENGDIHIYTDIYELDAVLLSALNT